MYACVYTARCFREVWGRVGCKVPDVVADQLVGRINGPCYAFSQWTSGTQGASDFAPAISGGYCWRHSVRTEVQGMVQTNPEAKTILNKMFLSIDEA